MAASGLKGWPLVPGTTPASSFPIRRARSAGAIPSCVSSKHYSKRQGFPRTFAFTISATPLALRQGVTLHTVSRMLGHSDPAMTLRRYAHVLDDMREDAGQAMDELF